MRRRDHEGILIFVELVLTALLLVSIVARWPMWIQFLFAIINLPVHGIAGALYYVMRIERLDDEVD